MQERIEKLYLSARTLEREVAALRATQPVLLSRAGRPGLALRVLMRLHPGLRRRVQVRMIRGCGLFDPDWYLRTYGDVAAAGADPALHFLDNGARERRDPGPHFDTRHYLRLYPDIAESGINPLLHYINAGWSERRSIRPGMPHEGGR